jgi:hypothetical protein
MPERIVRSMVVWAFWVVCWLIKTEIFVAERWFWKSYFVLWRFDKKGVRDIQQDINVLLEE